MMSLRREARRRGRELVAPTPPRGAVRPAGAESLLETIAVWVVRLGTALGAPSGPPADPALRRSQGGAVILAVVVLLVSNPALAAIVGVIGWRIPGIIAAHRCRDAERALLDETILGIDLCAIAIRSGTTVAQTIELVGPHLHGRLGSELRTIAGSHRAGALLDDLLAATSGRLGDIVAPFTTILRAAHADGDAVGPALTRLADRLRDERRRLVETDVRRLSVRLLVPLVCCSLPGFVLIAVVPFAFGALGGLR